MSKELVDDDLEHTRPDVAWIVVRTPVNRRLDPVPCATAVRSLAAGRSGTVGAPLRHTVASRPRATCHPGRQLSTRPKTGTSFYAVRTGRASSPASASGTGQERHSVGGAGSTRAGQIFKFRRRTVGCMDEVAGIYARESTYLDRYVQLGVAQGRVISVSFPTAPADDD